LSSKSTFLNSTSKSYALALYELAKENSELNKVEDGMDGIKTLLSNSSDFKEMILNPTVTKEEKNKVIIKIVDQYNFCETLKKFLGFLTTKNRLFFLNQIIGSFLDLISSSKGELKAKLLSSKKLSKSELEKIRNELSKDFQSPIKIDYKHDPDLIGGLVIQVGSVMVDASIKSKLRQLQKSMIDA
jgi:F-type H+-transporting ATPase subunit delta